MTMPPLPPLSESEMARFREAVNGPRGNLDAWLEVNNEAEVRAHVLAYGAACAAAERERIKFELLVAHERAQGRHNYYLCAVQEIFATDAAIRAQEKT